MGSESNQDDGSEAGEFAVSSTAFTWTDSSIFATDTSATFNTSNQLIAANRF